AYLEFPKLEAWVEGGFGRQFAEAERGRLRTHLLSEGTSSKDFEHWFLTEKAPELQARARKDVPEKGRPAAPVDPLVRAAASASPEQLLQQVRREPPTLAALRAEWLSDAVAQGLATAEQSKA